MCGIVGYIGKDQALKVVLEGLKTLEYRGYDSAGVAFLNNRVYLAKQVGRVDKLSAFIKDNHFDEATSLAIGHTRWATHGEPSEINAHPHTNSDNTIYVVHNGIIENHSVIRKKLTSKGYEFKSQTDTEVIPHLIDYYLKKLRNFDLAFETAIKDLEGAYAISAIYSKRPNKLYAARLSSPLVLGVCKNNNFILASDPSAIIKYTKNVVYLDDHEILIINKNKYKIKNIKRSKVVKKITELLDYDFQKTSLEGYPNYMLKEINETPQTIRMATLGRIVFNNSTVKLGGLESVTTQLQDIDRIIIVACGTSYYAGLVGEYLIEEVSGIPVEVQLASEFKYRKEPISRKCAILAISQSGETADTIAALKKVEDQGILRLGVVNSVGSTIARMTNAGVYCHAGPEQAVASTKAFVAQVAVLSLIAIHLAKNTNKLIPPFLKELDSLPSKVEELLKSADKIEKLAQKYTKYDDFLFIGRGYLYPVALEGALKLKEISYIHAEGYAAGEMKHGPLALIDRNFATLALAPKNGLSDKTMSNIEEIKARGGPVIVLTDSPSTSLKLLANDLIVVPKTSEHTQPILCSVALQLFAYYCAVNLKRNVDRPRNLAKSVTVE